MNLVMNERNLNNWWCNALRTQAPIVHSHRASPTTHREIWGKRMWREWAAHRTWEDDGGSVGQDLRRVAR